MEDDDDEGEDIIEYQSVSTSSYMYVLAGLSVNTVRGVL